MRKENLQNFITQNIFDILKLNQNTYAYKIILFMINNYIDYDEKYN